MKDRPRDDGGWAGLAAGLVLASGAMLLYAAVDRPASDAVARALHDTALGKGLGLVTYLGDLRVWLAAGVALFWFWDREAGLWLLVLLLAGTVVSSAAKVVFHVERPSAVWPDGVPEKGYSFPSGHSERAAAAAAYFGAGRSAGLLLLAGACLVAFSRVALGVHRLSDVCAGLGVGIFVALACLWARRRAAREGAAATRGSLLVVGALLTAGTYLFSHEQNLAAAYAVAGFFAGLGLPPAHAMASLKERFTPARLALRAVVGLAGAGAAVAAFLLLPRPARPGVALFFGFWVSCLAPLAFTALEGRLSKNTETSPPSEGFHPGQSRR